MGLQINFSQWVNSQIMRGDYTRFGYRTVLKNASGSGPPPHPSTLRQAKKRGECGPSQSCPPGGPHGTSAPEKERDQGASFSLCFLSPPVEGGTAPPANMAQGSQAPATGKTTLLCLVKREYGVKKEGSTPLQDLPEKVRYWQNPYFKGP